MAEGGRAGLTLGGCWIPLAPGAPAAPAGTVGPAAGRRAAGPSSALAQLSVQKGEPLSVLLADLAEEASFLHAESLEDAAKKKEKLGDRLEDAVRQRELRLIEQVRSVWEEEDGALGKDAEELRRRRGQEGRSGFEQALARYAGGDASREAALLLRLMEDDPPHAGEYREDLARLLAERSRAVEAGAASLPLRPPGRARGGRAAGRAPSPVSVGRRPRATLRARSWRRSSPPSAWSASQPDATSSRGRRRPSSQPRAARSNGPSSAR